MIGKYDCALFKHVLHQNFHLANPLRKKVDHQKNMIAKYD